MTSPTISNRADLDQALRSYYIFFNPEGYAAVGTWDVSQVTDMSNLFNSYPDFNEDISGWNVSNVTDMNSMFANCSAFNQDIGGWNVSNVTNMGSMFVNCSAFNQGIGGWDVSNVTQMVSMFANCSAFNQDIGGWDVSNVTTMSRMFEGCSAFNQDLSTWNVASSQFFFSMFSGASAFNQDLSGWDTAASLNFNYMFSGATAFLGSLVLDQYRYWTINYHPNFPDAYFITDVFGPDNVVGQDFFNQPRPSAQGGGDPYIYPLAGPPVKLPNCSATYRLYQDERTVVNAEVRAASPAIQAEIVRAAADVGAGLVPISAEAYFFSRLHVAHRSAAGAPWEHVTVDLENRRTTGSTPGLQVGQPQLLEQPDQAYDPGARSHAYIPIRWGRGAGRRELLVHFTRNPQVRNGLSLRGPGLERGTGLMVRNFRPKLFGIHALESTAPVRLPASCRRPLTQRAIQGPTECTLAVRC